MSVDREPRSIELSDEIRDRLIQLCLMDSRVEPSGQTISAEQVCSVEEALDCMLPDPILAALANGDDGLVELRGFRIEDIVDNTNQAHSMGHPKEIIAVGAHPDSHCFWCISKRSASKTNPGITEYDNFDGSSK